LHPDAGGVFIITLRSSIRTEVRCALFGRNDSESLLPRNTLRVSPPDRSIGATFQTLPGAFFVVMARRRPATPR